MGKFFKKLFSRNKSKPEALHLSNSSLSTPTHQNNGAILTSSKNKRNILGRKKKVNKAAFPTSSGSGGYNNGSVVKGVPLAQRNGGDYEKENAHRSNAGSTRDVARAQAVFNQHQSMSYTKPTLSLIREEASPRSGEYISNSQSGESSGRTPNSNSGGKRDPPPVGGNQLLSPMSGSKPPLTPNRLRSNPPSSDGGRRPSNNLNVATNQFSGYNGPSLMDGPLSPDSSLRGQQILSPHSHASSNEMCLSQDADDEEYNRIAFEGASGNNYRSNINSSRQQDGFCYDSKDTMFPSLTSLDNKDPFSTGLPMPQAKDHRDDFHQMPHESQEDIRAWTPSPTKAGPSFTFQDRVLSPSAISGRGDKKKDLFKNFADFEPFDPNQNQQFHQSNNNGSSSRSVAPHSISPVSALLEDSRARRSGRGMDGSVGNGSYQNQQQQQRASSSINSAPVITSTYVRSQVSRSRGSNSNISKVIDNLELHVNKRQGSNTGSINSHNAPTSKDFVSEASSQHSRRSAESAIRDAKERIRRENMMNNESKLIDILANGGTGAQAAAAMNAKSNGENNWLFDEVTGTLGPRSHAADLESLGGRSNRSGKSKSSMGNKSHRSHRSKTSRSGQRRHRSRNDGDVSVDSRTSRNSRASYRSYQTTKSMVSQMSQESRSVANDLLRLEAQLSMVGKSRGASGAGGGNSVVTELNKRRDDCGMTVTSRDFSISRSSSGVPRPKGSSNVSAMARRAAARSMRSKVSVIAPPGKLGIILANRTDSRGTVVSGVRTSSVLAEQVSPGDRIIAIDDEDVSQMNVKEITTIMARKSEFERVLTLLAAPKQMYE
ncbi:hypothetical protein ACHAWO_001828 [Cyclotella atomus]|uniref:PDZ domain-containing protein n=1 Tax=Cyclotella atomus TaxID=382360 RepID=A0ABD3NC35_9STRA